MLDFLQRLDVEILLFFNRDLQSSVLDFLFPYFTNLHKIFWVKAFVFPALIAFWIYKARGDVARVLLALCLTAAISDTLGYRVLKSSFARPRPNNTPAVEERLRLLRNPQSYSFPSNHSMNSFAVGTVAVLYYPYLAWLFYPLATMVALFRLYAGVHYPSDLIGGAVFGILLALLLHKWVYAKFALFKRRN